MIVIKPIVDDTLVRMASIAREKIPRAVVQALNDCATVIRIAETKEIRDVFDRPTPFTEGAVMTMPARIGKYEAVVKLKDFAGKSTPASKYLASQITGGSRRLKRFELALRGVGILPEGYFAMPGKAAKMDAYGNMDKGQIVQILSYFKALEATAGYRGNMTDKRKAKLYKGTKRKQGTAYFVRNMGSSIVVFEATRFFGGNSIRPVLVLVRHVNYEERFDFAFVAEHTAKTEMPRLFVGAMRDAFR